MAKNHDFSDVVANIEATRFFLGNPAVLRFLGFDFLSSCQKSKKSLGGKYHNFWSHPALTGIVSSGYMAPLKWRIVLYTPGRKSRTKHDFDLRFSQ